ncbi:MAG: hypothetical protein IJ911_07040 [Salinivirgaceae bacterium]|nr:hypothetical protein [Salinivirgaceae bacterium]
MSIRIVKAISKAKLAEMIGISGTTLRKWLRRCEKALRQMGVSRNAKMLPPCAVKHVCEEYSIDLYEDEM